jgi:hypothetical protein
VTTPSGTEIVPIRVVRANPGDFGRAAADIEEEGAPVLRPE